MRGGDVSKVVNGIWIGIFGLGGEDARAAVGPFILFTTVAAGLTGLLL